MERRNSSQPRQAKQDSVQVDIQSSVEQLHSLEFNEIVPNYRLDARYARIKRKNDVDLKVSVHKLIKELPLHIMACVLSRGSAKWEGLFSESLSITSYLIKALRLLSTLSKACTLGQNSISPSAGYVTLDLQVMSTVIDMTNLLLLSCIGPEGDVLQKVAESQYSFKKACQQSQLIDLSIRAVLLYLRAFATQQGSIKNKNEIWNNVVEHLLNHPRGIAFIDAAFESSRLLVSAVRQVLIAEDIEFDRSAISKLTFATGAALDNIMLLCASPLFYYRMMLHDPHGTAALRLICECLCLHDDPLATPPFGFEDRSYPGLPNLRRVMMMKPPPYSTDRGEGAAELLAARGFALLRALGDYKDVIYLDQIMKGDYTREMTTKTMEKIIRYCSQILLRHSVKLYPVASGEGQLAINVLRGLELLSDDGNFRETLAAFLTPHLARLLALSDPNQFRSSWCGGKEAIEFFGKLRDLKGKEDINLVDVNSYSEESRRMSQSLEAAAIEYYKPNSFVEGLVPLPEGMSLTASRYGRRLALERAVLLSLLIVNLHYHDDNMSVELKDVFVNNLKLQIQSLQADSARNSEASKKFLDLAVQNANELFETVSKFGPPLCENEKCLLLKQVDVDLFSDIIQKLKAARAKVSDKE